MNEVSAPADFLATSDAGVAFRVRDFPVVFLSYDEPWADAHWRDLKAKFPQVKRVHGVKGLDACHKAAADAVAGDWVVTIDADTVVDAAFPDARIPEHLLTGNYRLDWLSQNAVNGLWTGNGSVKLWPKGLLREMRTHEAAPDDELSLDHNIDGVWPGVSGQVTMPERLSRTDPAQTAFHAFRAGFREAVFLYWMAVDEAARRSFPSWKDAATVRVLRIWCSIGRHSEQGLWVLYGARLGLLMPVLRPDWQPRSVNDYDWLAAFWSRRVRPRYIRGGRAGGEVWNWSWLEADVRALAGRLASALDFVIAEYAARPSQQIADSEGLSPTAAASRLDSLGHRLTTSAASPRAFEAARSYFEIASALDHPAAFDNLGRLHQLGQIASADVDEASWLYRAAAALGNGYAPAHLAELEASVRLEAAAPREARSALRADELPVVRIHQGTRTGPANAVWVDAARPEELRAALDGIEGSVCLVLDAGVEPAPAFRRHVPDPALVRDGRVIGYMSLCPVTGRPVPRGVRLASKDTFRTRPEIAPDAVLPTVLGLLPTPESAGAALSAGRCFAEECGVSPAFATVGRDVAFGDHWVIGLLSALLGDPVGDFEARCLSGLDYAARTVRIVALARRLQDKSGQAVPVWSVDESRALKATLPGVPGRRHWEASADAFEAIGAAGAARAAVLRRTADAVWGLRAPAARQEVFANPAALLT